MVEDTIEPTQLDNHCCNRRSNCFERQPRHRFLEPIHNVKDEALGLYRGEPRIRFSSSLEIPCRHRAASGSGGGAYRDRTDDLKLAKLALSQLS